MHSSACLELSFWIIFPAAVILILVFTYSYVTFVIVRPISIEIGLDDVVDLSFSKAVKTSILIYEA